MILTNYYEGAMGMRGSFTALFYLGLVFAALTVNADERQQPIDLSIESQRTDIALLELAQDAGVQIMFAPEIARNTTSPAVSGRLTVGQAMDILLERTSLTYQMMPDKLIVVKEWEYSSDNEKSPAPLTVAQQTAAQNTEPSADAASATSDTDKKNKIMVMEEIIVTAQKREQNLQDVPLSVSALTSADIDRRGLLQMSDYLNTIPGVTMTDRGTSRRSLIIRGMAVDPTFETGGQSTVGFYLGDFPLSLWATVERGTNTNMRVVDIERIEVLRGPQGTLFGASSLAGTVRYIPKVANLGEFEARLATEISFTEMAGKPNTMLQGVINVPLIEDTLGFRGVAYQFSEGGYIDDIGAEDPDLRFVAELNDVLDKAAGHTDIGDVDILGVRASLLWKPNDRFKAEFIFAHEEQRQKGIPEVQPDLPGKYQQSRIDLDNRVKGALFAPGGRGNDDELTLYNLILDYDLGFASLHSSTSYAKSDSIATFSGNGVLTDFAILDLPWQQHYRTSGVVEELRLTSQFDGPLQGIIGYYYDDIDRDVDQQLYYGGDAEAYAAIVEPAFGPNTAFPLFFSNDPDIDERQKSFFGEINYQFLDRFEATVGARHYDYFTRSIVYNAFFPFLGAPPPGVVEGPVYADDDGVSYKAGISYKPGEDALLYAQWAEGFRQAIPHGEFEASLISLCDTDSDGFIDQTSIPISAVGTLQSDTAENYELGAKLGNLFNHRAQLNVAVYQVDWDGLPIAVRPPCGALFRLNASEARSRGIEVESNILLTDNLLLNVNAAYVDAELTKDTAFGGGSKGDPLPGSPDFTLSTGLQYDFEIAGRPSFFSGDVNYVGGYYSTLEEVGTETGDYWLGNVRAGVTFKDSITIEVFIKNIAGADELTWQEVPGSSSDERAYRLRPRTIGLSFRYDL